MLILVSFWLTVVCLTGVVEEAMALLPLDGVVCLTGVVENALALLPLNEMMSSPKMMSSPTVLEAPT